MAARPRLDLESPFLSDELFAREPESGSEARAERLAAQSPFLSTFEEGRGPFDLPEMDESKSFDEQPFLEGETGVINGDNRVRITPTIGVPWRWICRIEVKRNGEAQAGGGTGVLISDRHVLTAAHVVYEASQNMQNFSIQVIPGLDYDEEPFGSYAVTSNPKLPRTYSPDAADHLDWDYAMLKLSTAIGKKTFGKLKGNALCFWGSQQCGGNSVFSRPDPATLNGKAVFTAGYPRSAGAKKLMCAAGILHSANRLRRTMGITADTSKGQSGSPVWTIENGRPHLVAIAAGAGKHTNTVVRVTRELVRQLRAWIAEDGETPTIVETEEPSESPALALPYPEAGWAPGAIAEEAEDFTGTDYGEDELEPLHEQAMEEDRSDEEEASDALEGEEELDAAEGWEELEEGELTAQSDQEEDESLDSEGVSIREDETKRESPERLAAGESDLDGFPAYSSDELSFDSEHEWDHSELEVDLDPDLEGENGPLALLGRPDFWPDAVYITKGNDDFLIPARGFHKLWGLKHAEFESLEGLIGLIAKAKRPGKRIRVISHASDGFIIPLFNGSPAGFAITQKQIEALNAGDGAFMDELLGKLVDMDKRTDDGFVVWNALLIQLESNSPAALKPFALTSKTKPSGDLDLLLRRCADLVAVASADSVFKKAVRKSIVGAQGRLKRSKEEVDALEAAVKASGLKFTMSPPAQDMVDRLRAAVGALDNRRFRKTLKDARTKLKDKWIDFRGCRIGYQPKYLEAFAILMGTDGCTAPDWWSGYPGVASISDKEVSSAASFKGLVNSSAAAVAAMNRWGAREVTGWSSVAAADKPTRFFDDFLVAQNGVFPVYEVDYSGTALKEKYTLYWNSGKGKKRWLESMWDRASKNQVELVARGWREKMPRMAGLALHLMANSGSQANPQNFYVVPEREFRDHIIEVKKP